MSMMGPPLTTGTEPDVQIEDKESPADGHTFRIGVDIRPSYRIQDDQNYRDSEDFDTLPQFVEVRAWNITDALRKASDLPLSEWIGEELGDD